MQYGYRNGIKKLKAFAKFAKALFFVPSDQHLKDNSNFTEP